MADKVRSIRRSFQRTISLGMIYTVDGFIPSNRSEISRRDRHFPCFDRPHHRENRRLGCNSDNRRLRLRLRQLRRLSRTSEARKSVRIFFSCVEVPHLTVGSNARSRCELVHISGCKFLRSIVGAADLRRPERIARPCKGPHVCLGSSCVGHQRTWRNTRTESAHPRHPDNGHLATAAACPFGAAPETGHRIAGSGRRFEHKRLYFFTIVRLTRRNELRGSRQRA
jgi:hypothetical protein